MKNIEYLKENYKSSTIPRLKTDMGYKTNKEINKCPYITYVRFFMYNPTFAQQTLFDYINHSKRTGKMMNPKTLQLKYGQVKEPLIYQQ